MMAWAQRTGNVVRAEEWAVLRALDIACRSAWALEDDERDARRREKTK